MPEFPPPSILPRKSGKITKLLEIDALELARQLTILESELFFKIKQSDCIARSKESMPAGPDTIKSVINLANKVRKRECVAVIESLETDYGARCLIGSRTPYSRERIPGVGRRSSSTLSPLQRYAFPHFKATYVLMI